MLAVSVSDHLYNTAAMFFLRIEVHGAETEHDAAPGMPGGRENLEMKTGGSEL